VAQAGLPGDYGPILMRIFRIPWGDPECYCDRCGDEINPVSLAEPGTVDGLFYLDLCVYCQELEQNEQCEEE
jgi:hypothetical protein